MCKFQRKHTVFLTFALSALHSQNNHRKLGKKWQQNSGCVLCLCTLLFLWPESVQYDMSAYKVFLSSTVGELFIIGVSGFRRSSRALWRSQPFPVGIPFLNYQNNDGKTAIDTQTPARAAFTVSSDQPVILTVTTVTHMQANTWDCELPLLTLSYIPVPLLQYSNVSGAGWAG